MERQKQDNPLPLLYLLIFGFHWQLLPHFVLKKIYNLFNLNNEFFKIWCVIEVFHLFDQYF